ncbi:MAG: hypothetical protein SFX72_20400 [Isosphaeraceae bacterium]|nr:hypothetical protein [Isosphaeraceae bacterium]
MRKRMFLQLVVLGLFIFVLADAAWACPNCKEAVANQSSPEAAGMRDGYFWSILLMLCVPFGLLGTGGFMIARAVRRGALPEF